MPIRPLLIIAMLLFTGCTDLTSPVPEATPRTAPASPEGFSLAQLDPGFLEIRQEELLVGIIFVPERKPEACIYMEYWYLFEDYVYPGAENLITTVIEPTEGAFPDLEHFEHAMGEQYPGGYLVEVEATERREECR